MNHATANNQAEFSRDRVYRYVLESIVGEPRRPDNGLINFIMLNPSTADETRDDPSVRRCKAFATGWGYERIVITNVFALRSTDPALLRRHLHPIGPNNDEWIARTAQRADKVVAAWGLHGLLMNRHADVSLMLTSIGISLSVLALSKSGIPKHPLYLSGDLEPLAWEPNIQY